MGVCESTVPRIKKAYQERGSIDRKAGSGGHNKKRIDNFKEAHSKSIEANPKTSIGQLAKIHKVAESAIRNAEAGLGLKSYVRRKGQLLAEASWATRQAKC